MRLSRQTSNALRVLLDCAAHAPDTVTVQDIAKRQAITLANCQKLVASLSAEGFLDTVRGRGGGVRLSDEPARISLGRVFRAMETNEIVADCFGDSVDCPVRKITPINRILDQAFEAFMSVMDEHTLADLMHSRADFSQPDIVLHA